jgi:hypothetical protein
MLTSDKLQTAHVQLYLGRGIIIHDHVYSIPPLGARVLLTAYGPQYHAWHRTHLDWVFHGTPSIQFPSRSGELRLMALRVVGSVL